MFCCEIYGFKLLFLTGFDKLSMILIFKKINDKAGTS